MYKYIEIVFENCESIILPLDRVETLEFGKLELISDFPSSEDDMYYESEKLFMSIKYINESCLLYDCRDYDEPLGMFIDNPTSNMVEERPNILGRILNINDIVCIEYLNDSLEVMKSIYVPWSDESEYNNVYMKTESDGNVLKVIINNFSCNIKL